MKSKKKLLASSRLYVIIDKSVLGSRSILRVASAIKDSGADIIQFRDKESREHILETVSALRHKLLDTKVIFIINDYLDIAKILNTDGIHLGQHDFSIEIARKILGKDKIIGISCHNLEQAIDAQKRGADYIGIGPIFKTPIKSDITETISLNLIKKLRKKIKIPFFAIGGINEHNIKQVLSSGAKRIAVCSAVCRARNVLSRAKKLSSILKRSLKNCSKLHQRPLIPVIQKRLQ